MAKQDENKMSAKEKKKSPKQQPNNKKVIMIVGGVTAGVVVVISAILIAILSANRGTQTTDQQDYEKVDLANMPVAEACAVAKANNWEVKEPISGEYSSYEKIDCDNTYADVKSAKYNKSARTVELTWQYHRLTEDEYSGKTVAEICELGKQYKLTVDPTSSFGSTDTNNEYVRSCDDNRVPDRVAQEDRILHFVFAKGSNASSGSSSSSSSSNSTSSSSASSNSTDANFRKVMADYENFMNKYVDFMKKYKNSSDTASMLAEYSTLMQEYAKFAKSIEGYNQSNLSAADWAYYLEVTARVNKKLLEIQ